MTNNGASDAGLVAVQVNYPLADQLSFGLLHNLSQHDVSVGDGVAACALTIGRLLFDQEMNEDEEANFIATIIEFASLYKHEGKVN